MALHPDEMDAAIIRNLTAKTGKDLQAWIKILNAQPAFEKPKLAVDWLKAKHGIGHISAQVIVRHAAGSTRPQKTDLEQQLFATSTIEQKKLYGQLKKRLTKEVPGTVVTPCKTYTGFGNPKQYAVIKPDRGGGLIVGLGTISKTLPKPAPAKGLGGGGMKWKIAAYDAADIDLILSHLTETNV
jgi:hypothetical protein